MPAAPPPDIAGISHRTVTVAAPDGPLAIHLAEGGSGPPVLLLHGWPQHWWTWRKVIPHLLGDFRVLAPDLRGFGWSATPGRGYDPETFAADAVALLDALELEKAFVLGHDWGGFTAYLLGLRHAERVDAMVVCNSPHPWARFDAKAARELWRTWYVNLIASPAGPRVLRTPQFVSWFMRLGGRRHVWHERETEQYAAVLREPERGKASMHLYRQYLKLAREVYGRRAFDAEWLTVPTRAVFGLDDFYVPVGMASGAEAHADDWGIALLEGCGHWTPEERPEAVASTARDLFGAAA